MLDRPYPREEYPDSWILVYSGNKFWPLDASAEEIRVNDIAHALAMKCRFSGHCLQFYSVAEHCVLASRLVPSNLAKEALLHDAAEAYLADVASPIKSFISELKAAEKRLERIIEKRFGLEENILDHPVIKDVDHRLVVTERERNMPAGPPWETHKRIAPYPSLELPCWSPRAAEHWYKERCRDLGVV